MILSSNKAYQWREWLDSWTDELPLQPSYPLVTQYDRPNHEHISEADYKQTYPQQTNMRRIWPGLEWTALTTAQASTLISFFEGHIAAQTGFYWVQPDGVTRYRVKVRNPKLEREQRGPGLYRVRADLIELKRAGNYGT